MYKFLLLFSVLLPFVVHAETKEIKEEQTLSIIKPDAVKKNVIGKIYTHFEKAGLKISAAKMLTLSKKQAEDFYAEHKGKPFFEKLIKFMTSGPIMVQVLEGKNAIKKNREVMGATDSKKAKKGTIRHAFGTDGTKNATHGSDSPESAKREIDFFFTKEEICSNKKSEESMKETNPIIVMETNQGTIKIQLKPDVAPKTCENFIGLAKKKYYDGLIFHRVIKQFMIQGGDPTGTGRGGASLWDKPFKDECSYKVQFSRPGILAMANAGPNTNGSQFFITTAETPHLNNRHTIFGEVIDGMDIITKIENTKTGPHDKPLTDQKILKLYLQDDKSDIIPKQ